MSILLIYYFLFNFATLQFPVKFNLDGVILKNVTVVSEISIATNLSSNVARFRSISKQISLRSRRSEMFRKKGVLTNFTIFLGKHLWRSHFFKIAGLQHATLLHRKETPAQVFSSEFCKVFKNTYFIEHLRQPLLQSPFVKQQV